MTSRRQGRNSVGPSDRCAEETVTHRDGDQLRIVVGNQENESNGHEGLEGGGQNTDSIIRDEGIPNIMRKLSAILVLT